MTEARGVGRPTKYSAEVQKQADHYLLIGFQEQDQEVPTAAGLCCYLGVSRSTLYEWESLHSEFSDTLGNIQTKQEVMLVTGGLRGSMNPTITKLMMANHGYSDKQNVDHTTNGESMAPKSGDFSAAVLAALEAKHSE